MDEQLTNLVLAFVRTRSHIAGENLSELTDFLPNHYLSEELEAVLTQLVKDGRLKLHVRKGQFLHLHPVLYSN